MKEKNVIENEIKLESIVNSQLKMVNIENREEIRAKLFFICKLLGISMGAERELQITDEYYDTGDDCLKEKGCSLRKRTEVSKDTGDSKYLITIKLPHPAQNTVGVARNEWEQKYSEAEANEVIVDKNKIVDIISNDLETKISIPGELVKKLSIINARTCIPITTDVAQYTLCMDKYYIYFLPSGIYSEYQYEIEVEKLNGLIGKDDQLEKLQDSIKVFLNYNETAFSKYKTARNWKQQMEQIFTVMFDIVGYTKKPADIQRNSIQLLNRSIKKAIRAILERKRITYLPTGDGMILILDGSEDDAVEKIIKLCYQVQKNVKMENETQLDDKKIDFRTGVHVGKVFKYSDINDSPNYAGDGINKVSRVTGIGDAWHILATEAFYDNARDSNIAMMEDFHDIGEYSVKHGKKINVYNIYNKKIGVGNPVKPAPKVQ